ncbi:AraC-type DNA-binding protein [Chitinophaga sp. CF118]|uniref:helix-turn-helix domain-containing protein n=1 Tax=Chitinophaga sp. CF118 TaxID=1884367 RepID=UPI0008DFEF60|nr:helix-turn-helix domain-containing protein [Chitinophaga sp. CF118]SFD23171.1 AraC-type DNA-binding protein [Chitinophaga sp. CF118]
MDIVKTSPLYLGKYVQCFYSVLSQGLNDIVHRRLPDGTLDLVFNLGAGVTLSRDEVQFDKMPGVSLTGLYPNRSFLQYNDKVHLVGIVFQPGAAHLFINDSLEHIKASTIDAGDVFGQDIYSLLDQLNTYPSEIAKHRFLEQFLMRYVRSDKDDYHLSHIFNAVRQIHAAEGNLDIGVLHRQHLMSERNFRRKFVECVGMSPKQYAGIIRIKSFSKRYESSRFTYGQVSDHLGYNDQAHFNKDFQKIVGTSPGIYFNQLHPIAENFIHLI